MAKKGKEKPKDDRNEEERMKRIMMAATGYETVEEARQKPSVGAGRDGKAITSAKEFLEDMEDEVNHDVANFGGTSGRIMAPDQKDDMKLNSVLIGGPAPQPPERRKVLHSQLANTLSSSRAKSAGVDQSTNLMDPSIARRGTSNAKGGTSLTSRIFGASRYSDMNDADDSMDSEEYIIGKRHMVRYYNSICFLVLITLFMLGATLLTMTIMANQGPEPIEQTNPDATREVSNPHPDLPVSSPTSIGRFEDISSRLVDTGFAEPSKLRNGVTAQSKALDWLTSHDPAALHPSSEALLPRYVLAVLFYSTSGRDPKSTDPIMTSWKQHELWLTGGSYCEWHGIKCVGEDDYFVTEANGTIFSINLAENKLKGTIPSELAALSDLHSLNLKSNSLKGTIPDFKFPAMKDIYLDYNHLNGTVNLQFEFMKELRTLSLPYNDLTGSLPATIGSADKLRYIKLGGNQLTGTFPADIASLTHLETLHISRNRLSGSIPDEFFEMKRLVNVSMSQNLFEGKLSPKLSQLSHLQELHLTGNDFSGTVPDAFDTMILLATLHLGENRLSGAVPTSLGSRHRLEKLDLTANDFVGTMPQEICDLQQTGKLYHLGADCVNGDNTALDLSSFNDNRRHRKRRLVKVSRPPKDEEDIYFDPDVGKPRVRAGTARLGGGNDDDDEEEEEVIDAGDFVFLEQDGTVEDKDGNVIDGVAMEDLEDTDSDADTDIDEEEIIGEGDFVFVDDTDGTFKDKDGNVIDGVAIEDLEDLDADLDADEEIIGEGDFVFLEEDGTVEDQDGNVIDGVNMGDLEDLDADADEEPIVLNAMNKQTATLSQPDDDEDDGVIEFTQPTFSGDGGADGQDFKIAYASQEVLTVDTPENMDFSGIECPCCTFCLAAASSPETENTESTNIEGQGEGEDEEPIGSETCSQAIKEGMDNNEYPGLVGMEGKEAKKCLQMNTNKTVILVRPGVRRHFPYVNTRIIVYLDRNGDVKKTPKVG
mmetsp:Transcript_23675/g.58040  ORF Transcript_23675/g.58040 Transcript_23675/m.58040 type:complete len:989 (-) Transcript_23675:62-3028(-)|eukprot:CAMPEP_0113636360 /NCGR_PEP_ID=MMETSP0017_2-20120614/18983_1 /TAXON_ID=2856 /ORGANISM="Cylindrotheca closterium" /LENGTH=988 /DNA_ID=CAMNT_0000547239 /DNA_START=48 /DNA_END=3014 /DNA_ORIENTATION=- /assembly_acc=CAM_ASM_000147